MKDLHQNQEIVLTKEPKEVQAIQQKDLIVVVQRDHHQNQEIVHIKEPKEVQAIQQKDLIVVVQRDHHQNQEIVHTKEPKEVQAILQKDPIVVAQRDHLQNQEIVLSEEQRDHHLMHTKAKYAVRMTDLKGIHKNAHLAELKSPLESQMKDQPAVGQKDHHQNRVIVHTKDRKHHFVTRITNLVAAG
jgi:hypothetical protein